MVINNQSGFTLVEVLVALLLLALAGVMAWRGIEAVDKHSIHIDMRMQESSAVFASLNQLGLDLQKHAGESILPYWQKDFNNTIGKAILLAPGLAWQAENGLFLIRSGEQGKLQLVNWHVKNGALYRRSGNYSINLPLPGFSNDLLALQDLGYWQIRLWHQKNGWLVPADFVKAVNSDEKLAAVELSFSLTDNNQPVVYRKVVLLP